MLFRHIIILGLLSLSLSFSGCGFRSIPQSKNLVEASLAEITNQYKRRADLIPNLVKTVKGYAKHEKDTLQGVVEARAKATSITIDPSNVSPAQLKSFQAAQGGLSQALGKLMVVVEKYPNLKADRNFRECRLREDPCVECARGSAAGSDCIGNSRVKHRPLAWLWGAP